MNDRRFNSISDYYKEKFGTKVYKLALNIGATCPNRDGTKGWGGCKYCSEQGSGDYAELGNQIDEAIMRLGQKASGSYIAYFQSFSNTYMPSELLDRNIKEILSDKDIVGVALATRCDCLSIEILDYLVYLNKKTHLVVELGLQTVNDSIAKSMNRCHTLNDFLSGYRELEARDIKTCVHIIDGLPGETRDDMLKTIDFINRIKPFSVKIHTLHVLKNTALSDDYLKGKFETLTMNEYIEILTEQIRRLHKDIKIERITGDGNRKNLISPLWTLNKRYVLNSILKFMKDNEIRQGDYYEKYN